MKLFAIVTSFISAMALVGSAQASNTINFHGEITESTCDSTVVGGNDVILPTVSTNAFAPAVGSPAGRTQFVIDVSGCTLAPGKTKVAAYFNASSNGAANVDNMTGYLNNMDEGQAGGAAGVKLQLIDGASLTPIHVGYAAQSTAGGTGFDTVTAPTAGTARLNYFVEYVKTADITPGTVEGNVIYDLMYE
ncbi:fimbrial protein [Enterobacteriaceae bacterium Kacie_13]|nr:fimbrial protein [Enterobacteriaceae bacterium Kacie_13]